MMSKFGVHQQIINQAGAVFKPAFKRVNVRFGFSRYGFSSPDGYWPACALFRVKS